MHRARVGRDLLVCVCSVKSSEEFQKSLFNNDYFNDYFTFYIYNIQLKVKSSGIHVCSTVLRSTLCGVVY